MNRFHRLAILVPAVLTSCSCSVPWREHVAAPKEQTPTPALGVIKEVTVLDEIRPHELAVVKFFATWCGACQASKIPFEQLAGEHPGVPFFAIDVDKAKELAQQFGIESIPTIVIFSKGEAKDKFTGLDIERIKTHLTGKPAAQQAENEKTVTPEERATDKIVKLTHADHFNSKIPAEKIAIVKFYSNHCGFCKMIAPYYKELAEKFSNKIKFFEMESEHIGQELGEKFSIRGFPTFVIFKDGTQHNVVVGANKKALDEAIQKAIA